LGEIGEIEVAGPDLAHNLTELGLIDEYHLPAPGRGGAGQDLFRGASPSAPVENPFTIPRHPR